MSYHPDLFPQPAGTTADTLQRLYRALHRAFGPQHWWPARTPFEMAVGAILTQNTAWTNVEKAIANLRQAEALNVADLHALGKERREELIRPAGLFRQKSERLKLFSAHLLDRHQGDLLRLLSQSLESARAELLAQKGIGPETADSILLYAGHHPSFVIDAYTRRVLDRLGHLPAGADYETLRRLFMHHLPSSAPLYNEFHALIVLLAKQHCRKRRPLCRECPLGKTCPVGQSNDKS